MPTQQTLAVRAKCEYLQCRLRDHGPRIGGRADSVTSLATQTEDVIDDLLDVLTLELAEGGVLENHLILDDVLDP